MRFLQQMGVSFDGAGSSGSTPPLEVDYFWATDLDDTEVPIPTDPKWTASGDFDDVALGDRTTYEFLSASLANITNKLYVMVDLGTSMSLTSALIEAYGIGTLICGMQRWTGAAYVSAGTGSTINPSSGWNSVALSPTGSTRYLIFTFELGIISPQELRVADLRLT